MDVSLRRLVERRAAGLCEYCRIPLIFDQLPPCMDHVIAVKHHGPTVEENLAHTCYECNAYKGDNIAGIDPATGKLTPLFHPRRQVWKRHFHWDGAVLVGKTAVGRTTIDVLNINTQDRVRFRQLMIASGDMTC